jgi:hypothetical protein
VRFGVVRVSHTAAAIADTDPKLQALTEPEKSNRDYPPTPLSCYPKDIKHRDTWESRVVIIFDL